MIEMVILQKQQNLYTKKKKLLLLQINKIESWGKIEMNENSSGEETILKTLSPIWGINAGIISIDTDEHPSKQEFSK
jgi:hypothetical protein